MRGLILLLLLPWSVLAAPAPVGTDSTDFAALATNWSSRSFSHTIPSGATICLVSISTLADDSQDVSAVAWDTAGVNESFTLVDRTTSSGLSGDNVSETWAIVSPTAKTANITMTGTGSINHSATTASCFNGSETASVAAATNFVAEDVDDVGSDTTNAPASGGSSGNIVYVYSAFRGSDTDPISSDCTELTEHAAATAAGELQTQTSYAAAPAGCTHTASVADEHSGHSIEIVAASASSVAPILVPTNRRRRQ